MIKYVIACINCSVEEVSQLVSVDADLIELSSNMDAVELAELNNIDAFFIGGDSDAVSDEAVNWLRVKNESFITPIFMVHGHHLLADTFPADFASYMNTTKRQAQSLPNNFDGLQHRLCSDLYVDQRRQLSAGQDLTSKKGFRYPLLKLWGNSDTDNVLYWLAQQAADGLIKPVSLITRTRSCTVCDSTLLNYIDTCSACNSIDISTEEALHCFTCGNIGKQSKFQRGNKLECPNCLTQLRHIGTDYDRPIENIRCNSCNRLSVASSTRAHCYSCHHDNSIEDLVANDFYNYEIAIHGIELAQKGRVSVPLAKDITDVVGIDHLAWLICWMLNSEENANGNDSFILKITASNYAELKAKNTETELAAYVSAFTQRLSPLLSGRNTKVHIREDQLLVLFPYSDTATLEKFAQQLSDLAKDSVENPLHISVSQNVIGDNVANHSSQEILAWLQNISEKDD
mgnify:CR=1 FL=1